MSRKITYIVDVDEKGAVRGAQKTEKALEQVDKQAKRTGKSGTQMAAQMQNAGRGTADLERNSRGANQVLFSMSDAIQDASFAGGNLADISRFAGNNIAVAAEQFAVMSARAGGGRAALQSVIGSFFGVGGLITALNLGLVALNLFGDGLSNTEEKAEDLNEDVNTLISNWEKTIELQEQFGAFEEDELGLEKIDASLKEAGEDLSELNADLEAAQKAQRDLNKFRREYGGDGGPLLLTPELSEELQHLEAQARQYDDITDLKEEIKTTEGQINDLVEKRNDIVTSLLDSDTQEAKNAHEQREREKELTEEKQRQLALDRMIAEARASTAQERPEDEIFMDVNIPDAPEMDFSRFFPEGSLGHLREQMRGLKEELLVATDPEKINQLNSAIGQTQEEMDALQGKTKAAGDEYGDQAALAVASNIMMADSAEDAANRAIDAIFAEIVALAIRQAMKLPFPANIVAAAGAAAAAKGLQSLIPEFALGGLAVGPSHQMGGIMGLIGGQPALELEGGEAIINRKSTRMFLPQLNAINQAGGGVPLAADGALTLNNISRDAGPLPMISGGSSLEGVLSKLTQVLEDGITARTDLTELEDVQTRLENKMKALGNT